MSEKSHVQPRRSTADDAMAFVDSSEFAADPGFYVNWVIDNHCDLAVWQGKALQLGLMIAEPTPTGVGARVPSIAIDEKTFVENLGDVIDVLRSGNVNAQMRITEPGRDANIYLYSEGKGVLSSIKGIDYTLSAKELIDLAQQERLRQATATTPVTSSSRPEPASGRSGEAKWSRLDTGDDAQDLLRYRMVRTGETAGKMAFRTVKVATEKVAIPAAKYVYEVWRQRDLGIKNKVMTDAKEQWRQLRNGPGY